MITDDELHDLLRQRLSAETAHLNLRTDPVPWVHGRLRRRRNRRIAQVVGVVITATLAAVLVTVQSAPRPTEAHKSSNVLQRFHMALVDAVSDDVIKITGQEQTFWVHQGDGRMVSPDGLSEDVVTTQNGEVTATVVNYTTKTWYTMSTSVSNEPTGVVTNPCDGVGANMLTFADPTALQQELKAEQFVRVPGTQVVDGQTTVELESSCNAKPVATIYLNANTLLPVEMMPLLPPIPEPHNPFVMHFAILPATPANLAHLKLQIPAGFTQVPGT